MMGQRRVIRRAVVACAALAMFVAGSPAPSGAVANLAVGTVSGWGTITPGLNVVPDFQTWTFDGLATMSGTTNKAVTVLGTSWCFASGSSIIPENFLYGAGSGSWSCATGPLAGKGGGLVYERTGAVVLVALTAPAVQEGVLACVFIPGSLNLPVTSYSLLCEGAFGGVK